MGLFERFKLRRMENGAKRWGRWCAKAMVFSFTVFRHQYEGVAPTYAWLARKALSTRNDWKQINDTEFVFEKNGYEATISDDMNLLQVIHIVIDVEFGHDLESWGLPLFQRHLYLTLAHEEADKEISGNSPKR
jgi:hypothetical protein